MIDSLVNSRFLNLKTQTVTASAVILAFSTVISSLLGFVRDWLLSRNFGAGPELDAYFAAFRIPDFIYNILIYGGVSVVFLPLFSELYARNREEAWRFSSNLLNVFLFATVILCAFCFFYAPLLINLIAPGFSESQAQETIFLTRLLFLSPIFFGISSVVSGVLHYFNRFLSYSLAPIFYNLGIIAGILLFAPFFGIAGVVYGVILGLLLHLLVQMPAAANSGFSYRFIFKPRDLMIKKAFLLLLPRAFSVAASQLNLTVTLFIASGLTAGSITIFNFASNVYMLPVGIIGVSFAMAAFPFFSKLYAAKDFAGLADKFSQTFCQLGFVALPISFLMFLLRDSIVELIYRHGHFTFEAAALTSAGIGVLCLAVYFISQLQIIYRMFFALKDTLTPAAITFFSVVFCVFSSFFFTGLMGKENFLSATLVKFFNLAAIQDVRIIGLAIAFALTTIFQFAIAGFLLYCKNKDVVPARDISLSQAKILLASMAVFLVLGFLRSHIFSIANPFLDIVFFGFTGGIFYLAAAFLLKLEEAKSWKSIAAVFIRK